MQLACPPWRQCWQKKNHLPKDTVLWSSSFCCVEETMPELLTLPSSPIPAPMLPPGPPPPLPPPPRSEDASILSALIRFCVMTLFSSR